MPEESADPAGEPPRSYQAYRTGQQKYAVIEYCSNAQTLWAKLESGKWEWLGVKDDGRRHTFVLGRPPRSGILTGSSGGGIREKDSTGEHRVQVETPKPPPLKRGGSTTWCATEQRARERYAKTIERLNRQDGSSGIYRVSLYVSDQLESREYVVRTLPNLYPPKRQRSPDS
jgi:hypothetical protein